MAWDYLWKAGAKGGALTSLSDHCLFVRQTGEVDAGLRGTDPVVQYRHGSYAVRKWAVPKLLSLECGIRYTNSAGAVTHADGASGHFYENLAAVRELFGGSQGGQATVQQTAPDWGEVELDVEQRDPSQPTQQRWVIGFLLTAADPFWRSTTQQSSAGNPAVGGNAPSYPIIELTGAGTDAKIVHDDSGAYVQIEGALPAGGVSVDCEAQTCTKISDGSDYSAFLAINEAWWMLLDPNKTNPMTRSGGGTITVKWNDRWR